MPKPLSHDVLPRMHPVEARFHVFTDFMFIIFVTCQAASYEHVVELRKIIAELRQANQEDSLEEQAALLLSIPQRMEEINVKLCTKLQTMEMPCWLPASPAMTEVAMNPPGGTTHLQCNLVGLSGDCVGKFYARKNQPWLDAVPFAKICHQRKVASFSLMDGSEILFPQARLN